MLLLLSSYFIIIIVVPLHCCMVIFTLYQTVVTVQWLHLAVTTTKVIIHGTRPHITHTREEGGGQQETPCPTSWGVILYKLDRLSHCANMLDCPGIRRDIRLSGRHYRDIRRDCHCYVFQQNYRGSDIIQYYYTNYHESWFWGWSWTCAHFNPEVTPHDDSENFTANYFPSKQ